MSIRKANVGSILISRVWLAGHPAVIWNPEWPSLCPVMHSTFRLQCFGFLSDFCFQMKLCNFFDLSQQSDLETSENKGSGQGREKCMENVDRRVAEILEKL